MLSILPAFSSPDLKVFLLLKKSFKSSAGGQRRDCVIYSVPLSLHSINPTDSPDSRISVVVFVFLSVGLCKSRKDRLSPASTFVRPAPAAPYGLASSRFQKIYATTCCARVINLLPPPRPKRADGRFRVGAELTVVPRPE